MHHCDHGRVLEMYQQERKKKEGSQWESRADLVRERERERKQNGCLVDTCFKPRVLFVLNEHSTFRYQQRGPVRLSETGLQLQREAARLLPGAKEPAPHFIGADLLKRLQD